MKKMNMRLNSLDKGIFAVNGANDEKVGQISRNDLIATGRLCASEYMGRMLSADSGSFKSRLNEFGGDYAALSKKHAEQKLIFCAARAYAAVGRPAPNSAEQVKNDLGLYKDPVFLRTMSAIDQEVISPLLYSVISDLGGNMLNVSSVGVGRTKEITVMSNDVFLWEDSAVGSANSASRNYLYADTITLNPKAYTCDGTIKWFQMIATDGGMDAGWYYTAIIRGLWSKIMALYTRALLGAAEDTRYMPSYLKFDSYSSANWANATTAVAVANGVHREQLMAFGEYNPLQAVLPKGTASDAALTYGLGQEWLKNGFVAMAGRVPLYEVMPSIVPGTVNTTGEMIGLGDRIFIAARVSESYAPVYAAMTEGWPLTLEYTPSQTADFTIDIHGMAMMDVRAVMPGKIGVIGNVTSA